MDRIADLRITPARKRRRTDVFCSFCGQFHDPAAHPPVRDLLRMDEPIETLPPLADRLREVNG